jgi:uncharacterized protein YggE
MDSGITVTGTGQATAPADLLRLTLSVGHDAADVAAAVAQVAEKTDAVHAALSAQGVEAKDIETSTVNVYPQYKNSMAVAGYRASHSITVTTRNLTGFGDLLNAAVDAVGNDLGMDGLNFDVADKQPLVDQARQLAFTQAREKAAQLAELAGQSLGSIAAVAESYGHGPSPIVEQSAKAAGAYDSSLTITPGEQTVQISLDVCWNWA